MGARINVVIVLMAITIVGCDRTRTPDYENPNCFEYDVDRAFSMEICFPGGGLVSGSAKKRFVILEEDRNGSAGASIATVGFFGSQSGERLSKVYFYLSAFNFTNIPFTGNTDAIEKRIALAGDDASIVGELEVDGRKAFSLAFESESQRSSFVLVPIGMHHEIIVGMHYFKSQVSQSQHIEFEGILKKLVETIVIEEH